MKFLNYAIVGSGLCSFIATLKVKILVLSKSSNNKFDVIKTLNFYEYNNLGEILIFGEHI